MHDLSSGVAKLCVNKSRSVVKLFLKAFWVVVPAQEKDRGKWKSRNIYEAINFSLRMSNDGNGELREIDDNSRNCEIQIFPQVLDFDSGKAPGPTLTRKTWKMVAASSGRVASRKEV